MPEAGDELTCRLDKGGKLQVTLEDRVYPDRSCGQYEAGWWVYDVDESGVGANDYFLSESGILYDIDPVRSTADYGKSYTRAIGIHVPWARRVRDMDREITT